MTGLAERKFVLPSDAHRRSLALCAESPLEMIEVELPPPGPGKVLGEGVTDQMRLTSDLV